MGERTDAAEGKLTASAIARKGDMLGIEAQVVAFLYDVFDNAEALLLLRRVLLFRC